MGKEITAEVKSDNFFRSGVEFESQNNLERAATMYSQSIYIYSSNTDSLRQRANCRFRLGNYAGAIEDLEKLLKIGGQVGDMQALANTHFANGDFDTAFERYTTYVSNCPSLGDSSAHMFLGMIHDMRCDHEKAIEEYSLVPESDPNAATAYNALGGVYQCMGNKKKAKEMYNLALKLEPSEKTKRNIEVIEQDLKPTLTVV